jgi:phage shock protein B
MTTILTCFIIVFFALFIVALWSLVVDNRSAKTQYLQNDKIQLQVLQQQSQRLSERLSILENILDERVPNWRKER